MNYLPTPEGHDEIIFPELFDELRKLWVDCVIATDEGEGDRGAVVFLNRLESLSRKTLIGVASDFIHHACKCEIDLSQALEQMHG